LKKKVAMPWTIYRYILREILKLLVVSTVVLVTVISFAAAVRPLADGVLGPVALMKFIGFTLPTMLGFALPFAGAFSATIVFLRLASDNEITACSASGISYASILVPVVLLGTALTMMLFFSSNFVMPWFYREASRIVETDLMSALVHQLDRQQPYILNKEGVVLFANRAEQHPVTQELAARIDSPIPPQELIVLYGVALGMRDDAGRIRSDATAEQANVLVFRDPATDASWVTMKFLNAMYYDETRGELVFSEEYVPSTIRIPSPFEDNVEFLSWPQLDRLRKNPDRYDDVRVRARDLVDAVSSQLLLQKVLHALQKSDRATLILRGPHRGERFLIRSPKIAIEHDVIRLSADADKPVIVEREVEGQIVRRFESDRATMRVDEQASGDEPILFVQLHDMQVWDTRRPQVTTQHTSYTMSRMVWPERVLGAAHKQFRSWDILEESSDPRYRSTAGQQGQGNAVIRAHKRLENALVGLDMRITAQFHSRAASAIASSFLLLLGAVLSMRLKDQMPLVVFFWCFMLAVVTIVIIHTGNNMSNDHDTAIAASLSVLWLGNVMLAIIIGAVYCRLARN